MAATINRKVSRFMNGGTSENTEGANRGNPLDGIRVLDLGTMVAAPYGATMLGDAGADVIKIEPPRGDDARYLGTRIGNESGLFVGVNRNKRGMVLDLRKSEGRTLFWRLVATADIVIHNTRASARGKLGIRYVDLVRHRPDIIVISVSAYGSTGPYADRPGVDPVAQALTGAMNVTGSVGGEALRAGIPRRCNAVWRQHTGAICPNPHRRNR